jgi:myo-inositol-1(or 4)-monophosphatase
MTDAKGFETIAIEAAHRGGAILSEHFRTSRAGKMETKGLHDFVTEVDREADRAIVEFLKSRCPDHDVMSEEGAPEVRRTGYRWIVDPLDGTTNFAHGTFPFSVSIGLEDETGMLAGAIHDPMHDETFHAFRGGGARLDGETIRCSRPPETGKALIATGFPFRELSRLEQYMVAFEAVVRSTAGLRRAGSAAIDLAYSACGRYDGFFEIGLNPWDLAAGALIVSEAGGRVTDVTGGDGWLESGDIVTGGPEIHAELLKITREAFG